MRFILRGFQRVYIIPLILFPIFFYLRVFVLSMFKIIFLVFIEGHFLIKNNITLVYASVLKLTILLTRSSPSIIFYALTDFPTLYLSFELYANSSPKPVPSMKHCLTEHLSMQFTLGLKCPLPNHLLLTVSEVIQSSDSS